MRNRGKILILCLAIGSSALSGGALAHDTNHHDGHMDAQMHKLHAMMPVFSIASAELETALEKGDPAAAKTQADRILTAIPDLKKSKPHKSAKQRKKYVELAANLEKAITTTIELAKKGDFAGATIEFRKIEETCAACHATFRD